MTKETKYISLSEFKAIEDGPGGFQGYASVFLDLDDGGDIVLPGAYQDTIPRFLKRGFTAHSHDWTFSELIGYPVEAREDEHGLFVRSAFHSTPDAQNVRVKASERQQAGMDVSLSIGYDPLQTEYIYPREYKEKLPQYIRPDLLDQALVKAAAFERVRLLKNVELYEYGLVSLPMLASALVSSVKGADLDTKAIAQVTARLPKGVKGLFEDELAERTNSLYSLFDVFTSVVWQLQNMSYMANEAGLMIDLPALLDEAVNEYMERLHVSVAGILNIEEPSLEDAAYEIASNGEGRKGGLRHDPLVPYAGHIVEVRDALNNVAARTEARIATLSKEGRAISAAREAELLGLLDDIEAAGKRIRKLLDDAKPKDTEKETEDAQKARELGEEVRKQYMRFLAMEATRNGVNIQ